MPNAFRFDLPPFDALTAQQQGLVRDTVDVVYYPAGAPILSAEIAPEHVYVVIKGHVRQEENGEVIAVYGPDDFFGARAMMAGTTASLLYALDEVIAYTVPKATIQTLIAANNGFGALLFANMSRRLSAVAEHGEQREFLSLMMGKVRDAYLRKPIYLDAELNMVDACRQLAARGATFALVDDGGKTGIFTTTDLRDAVASSRPPESIRLRELAHFNPYRIALDAPLFDALLLMIRHRVHRLVVHDGDQVVGLLTQLDLMGFVSNHSHLIAYQIEQAETLDELRAPAQQIDRMVELLHAGGIKVEIIAQLVREMNAQLFARLWHFVAPPALVANSCLLVMGSEGRGEQILKTDQDNALLLADGYDCPELDAVCARFTDALVEFGYPRCPGNIMVSNPTWRMSQTQARATINHWVDGSDPEGRMHLAIFFDADVVAGDPALLAAARSHLFAVLSGSDAFYAHFARAVEQFSETGGWWNRIAGLRSRDEEAFDLKKLGIFPIVHGARSLALKHQLDEASTLARLQTLIARQLLPEDLGNDLVEALHFLLTLRLQNGLQQRQQEREVNNLIRLSALTTLERDLLKDSLAITRRFIAYLQRHFRLDLL